LKEDQMTNALSTDTKPAAKPPVQAGGAVAALVPRDMEQAFRLANALAQAGDMVPKAFQGNPNATMAAIVRGMEIGLAPMQALASIAVINGRATIWGDAVPALVMKHGHHVDVEFEGTGDDLVAVATLTRGDTGKQIVRRFGMADAKRAGLAGKPGPWQQYPQRMCAHRARSWAVRDGAPDALMGLGVAEEAADFGPDRARDVTPAPRKGGVVYADPDPVVDEILEAEPVAEDAPEPLALAEAAAREGTDHFRAWYNTADGRAVREAGALDAAAMTRIKGICEAADLCALIVSEAAAAGVDATLGFYGDRVADLQASAPDMHAALIAKLDAIRT
jgi:hypothetical protein